jgi:serine/threonine-protein kinase
MGCPAAQVRPPEHEACPKEAITAMDELKIFHGEPLRALVDINQPGRTDETGVYMDGPVIGRITEGAGDMPEGTLLHGRLWTGPGIYDQDPYTGEVRPGREAIMSRYTLAILPDGRKYPVCIVLGNPDGLVPKHKGSKPGAAVVNRQLPASAVWRWP